MITQSEFKAAHKRVKEILSKAGVFVRNDEIEQMEIVDFGLSELDLSGAQIITLVDTESIAVKLLVLFPNQTEPEHKHPPLGDYIGKEKIIRCEWGKLYVYGPGEATPNPKGHTPDQRHIRKKGLRILGNLFSCNGVVIAHHIGILIYLICSN